MATWNHLRNVGVALTIVVVLIGVRAPQVEAYDYTAQGSWRTEDGELTGTWSAKFDVVGTELGGVMAVTGLPGVSDGNISGTMGSGAIVFSLYMGPERAAFNGTVDGRNFTGTFTTPDDISGTWAGAYGGSSFTQP